MSSQVAKHPTQFTQRSSQKSTDRRRGHRMPRTQKPRSLRLISPFLPSIHNAFLATMGVRSHHGCFLSYPRTTTRVAHLYATDPQGCRYTSENIVDGTAVHRKRGRPESRKFTSMFRARLHRPSPNLLPPAPPAAATPGLPVLETPLLRVENDEEVAALGLLLLPLLGASL